MATVHRRLVNTSFSQPMKIQESAVPKPSDAGVVIKVGTLFTNISLVKKIITHLIHEKY